MVLRKPFLSSLVSGLIFVAFAPAASAQNEAKQSEPFGLVLPQREASVRYVPADWSSLDQQQRLMVDLVARDFFTGNLTHTQKTNIAESTKAAYVTASPKEQYEFRRQRRAIWQKLNPIDRALFQSMPAAHFDLLTKSQKAPFREQAIRKMNLKMPISGDTV